MTVNASNYAADLAVIELALDAIKRSARTDTSSARELIETVLTSRLAVLKARSTVNAATESISQATAGIALWERWLRESTGIRARDCALEIQKNRERLVTAERKLRQGELDRDAAQQAYTTAALRAAPDLPGISCALDVAPAVVAGARLLQRILADDQPYPAGNSAPEHRENANSMPTESSRTEQDCGQRVTDDVLRILRELKALRKLLVGSHVPLSKVRQEHSGMLCIRIAEEHAELFNRIEGLGLEETRAFVRTAIEFVAKYHGKSMGTVEKDWNKHKPESFKRKVSERSRANLMRGTGKPE